jgi:hypothetical protein
VNDLNDYDCLMMIGESDENIDADNKGDGGWRAISIIK